MPYISVSTAMQALYDNLYFLYEETTEWKEEKLSVQEAKINQLTQEHEELKKTIQELKETIAIQSQEIWTLKERSKQIDLLQLPQPSYPPIYPGITPYDFKFLSFL